MKFAPAFALLATSAAAFQAPIMTFAVGKKPAASKPAATKAVATKAIKKAAPKKVAPKKVAPKPVAKPVVKAVAKPVVKKVAPKPVPKKVAPKKVFSYKSVGTVPSQSIPGEVAPALLDGSMIGDVGFDPCFLSTKADSMAPYFNGLFDGRVNIDGLTWYREAELMHGRLAQMAVLGFIVPGFAHFPGNEWSGVDAFATTNPLEAINAAPGASLFQIFGFMALLEFRRIGIIFKEGGRYMAGDSQKWGQGPGRWNPFGFDYTPAEYAEKQLQEIKHSRLAMIGLLGLVFQANASGESVVDQWGAALSYPDYVAKSGYFFPDGI